MQVTKTQFDGFGKETQETLIKNGVQIVDELTPQPAGQGFGIARSIPGYAAKVTSVTLNFKAVSGDDAVYGDAVVELEGVTPDNMEAVVIDIISNHNFPASKIYSTHREEKDSGFRKGNRGDDRKRSWGR
jgi:hypothetical protein